MWSTWMVLFFTSMPVAPVGFLQVAGGRPNPVMAQAVFIVASVMLGSFYPLELILDSIR